MRRPYRIFAVLLVLSLAASILLLRRLDQLRTGAAVEDVLYVSSPKLVKGLSLGYEGLLADIYWTRVVQYYGGTHHRGGGRYELLWPLLNITTQLDPHLIPAYEFGGTFLCAEPPNGAGLPQRAIELIEYGVRNNPGDWRLYYDLGFIYYDIKDYRGAAEAFLRGSKLPKAHPFMGLLAARMAEHGGDVTTARMLWSATYQTSGDKNVRANAAAHLRALQAEHEIRELQTLVDEYRARTKSVPETLSELVRAGLLRQIPLDPAGHPYKIEAGGRVIVADPESLPFLTTGLPSGYVPPAVPKLAPAS